MGITRTLRVISSAALTGALVLTAAPHATADQVRDDQWALEFLEAESLWKETKGEGQTVAVIDDGVNANHRDLKGNVLKGKDFNDGGSTLPDRGDDHGTAMASLIAGHGHGPGNRDGIAGLAPEAKILPIRPGFHMKDAVKYAVDQGASVINISLGDYDPNPSPDLADAFTYALKKNVPVFASTGNDGGSVQHPAAYPGVVAVGGIQQDGAIWPDSNRGPETLLTAPATHIVGAGGQGPDDYRSGTGTSDATAYASAAAALVRAEHPDLTAGQIVNRLTETAELPPSKKNTQIPDEAYGYGAIRPLDAITADVPKGDKWGPLSVPQSIKQEQKIEEKEREGQAMQEEADRKAVIIWSVIGVVGLLFIGVIVLTIVLVKRRKKKESDFGGPGGPAAPGYPGGGYPYPPGQAPGYGMPPHQQQPMPPQPNHPPHQG